MARALINVPPKAKRAELFPAVAANPFIAFSTVATESGTLSFEWTGDNGFVASESVSITVE